jgi:hypothetical protein
MKEVFTSRLRASTGMEAKVSAVHVGLLSPTLTIEGLKLYNTADFGGGLCLDMPELHIEYDRAALRLGNVHLPLVRLDLADLTVVENKQGRMNFAALKKKEKETTGHTAPGAGLKFNGIDTLNLSLGKFHLANLASGKSEEVNFGLRHQILHNVKSEADLNGLGLLLALRSAASTGKSDMDLGTLLKTLTGQ